MNKAAGLLIATLLLVTGCGVVAEKSPTLTGRVVDEAGLLDAESEAALASRLAATEGMFGPQLIVVTVKSLGEKSIEDFSLNLGNSWSIGDAKRDDGMMLVVAPNERRVRIEVGYGLESTFPDEVCQNIIDEAILPRFKESQMQQGIIDGVNRILTRIEATKARASNDNSALADIGMTA